MINYFRFTRASGKKGIKILGFVYEKKGKKLGKKSTGEDTAVFAHDEQHQHAFLIGLLTHF